VADGAGVATEDGDEVEVEVAATLAVGLGVLDGCGELVLAAGLVGGTVGVKVVGVTTAGVVEVVAGELAEVGGGLTQR
jgi:hypothetical protein